MPDRPRNLYSFPSPTEQRAARVDIINNYLEGQGDLVSRSIMGIVGFTIWLKGVLQGNLG